MSTEADEKKRWIHTMVMGWLGKRGWWMTLRVQRFTARVTRQPRGRRLREGFHHWPRCSRHQELREALQGRRGELGSSSVSEGQEDEG